MPDSLHLLRHEVRTALKENRFLLPLVPLVTLVTLAVYHGWVPIRFDNPAAFLANLLKTVWPAVAWIPPCLMLKRPDLRDPDAAWRTLPVSKEVVFESRLLVVVVFTVAIPALMVGLASLCANDGMAGSQAALMAAYQWAYLWLGALAACALRGHRGLALIPSMAVAVVLSALTFWCIKSFDTRFTESVPTREHRGAFGLLLPWLIIAIGGPVAAVLHIKQTDAKPRPWRWIAGAFLAYPAVILLQSLIGDSGRSILFPFRRLPTVEAALACGSGASGFNGKARSPAIDLPPGFNCYRTNEFGGYEWAFASGNWESRSGHGSIGKENSAKIRVIITPKSPGLPVMPINLTDTYQDGSSGNWVSFLPALGLTHPAVLGATPGKPAQWQPIPTESRRFQLAVDFYEPEAPKNEWFREKAGETVAIDAGIPLHEAMPPKMIFRTKLNTIGNGKGFHGEMPKDYVLQVLAKTNGPGVYLSFNRHFTVGAVGDAFGKTGRNPRYYRANFVALLLNRRLEQAVFLDGTSWGGESPWLPMEDITLQLTLPEKSTGGMLPKPWLDEAELIVLESENGPTTTLPLSLTFKVPDGLKNTPEPH